MSLLIPVLLVVLLLFIFFRPVPTGHLFSRSDPAVSYEDAEKRLQSWAEEEAGFPLQEVCLTKTFSHGHQTEQVILFFHGYTTCPEQFAELGQMFFEKGYNVLIPCMPHHGWKDRLTDEIKYLTAEELAAFGDRTMDIAHGLGKRVIAFGISGGGTVVSWLAQNRNDLDVAVPLAAFLRMYVLPAFLSIPFINLFSMLPNFFIWWDPRTKEKNPFSIYYAYPRYSLRNLAQIMRLGLAVERQARMNAPAAGKILVMENDFDMGVSNAEIETLTRRWEVHRPGKVNNYHFERDMKMLHDIITPGAPGVPTAEVYNRILHEVESLNRNVPSESEK